MIDDEMICPELRGAILVEDTGFRLERFWLHDAGRFVGGSRRQTILRDVCGLALQTGIANWDCDADWGGVIVFEEDDGNAVVVIRTLPNTLHSVTYYRALIFATSLEFWTKIYLKYR